MATKDKLTGAFNRRYIDEKLPLDLISCALLNQEISIIIADIDFFKNVNDTYGHIAGDEVLINFSKVLHGRISRESDWVSRYGGEEFLISLPGAGNNKALEIAEKMRKAVEASKTEYDGNNITHTASFGVATIKPTKS